MALVKNRELRRELKDLLKKKETIGDLVNLLRLGYARHIRGRKSGYEHIYSDEQLKDDLAQLLMVMDKLDDAITPLVLQDGSAFSERWGYLSIAGEQPVKADVSQPAMLCTICHL
jgi:hypothetical protein